MEPAGPEPVTGPNPSAEGLRSEFAVVSLFAMGVDIGALAFLGFSEAQGHEGSNRLQHRIGAHADPKDGEPRRLDLDPELADVARNHAIGTGRIEHPQGKDSGEQAREVRLPATRPMPPLQPHQPNQSRRGKK